MKGEGAGEIRTVRGTPPTCWCVLRWRSGTIAQTIQAASRSWEGPQLHSHQGNGDLKTIKFYQQPEGVRTGLPLSIWDGTELAL